MARYANRPPGRPARCAIDNAVAPLIPLLTDTEAGVRRQAAWALGALGDARALEPLLSALKDSDAGVRRQAAWAVGVVSK